MNNLKFENAHYEKALEYTQKYSKNKEDDYYKIDLPDKSDQIWTQQNNTIHALLTYLYYRITLLENKLLKIEQLLINTSASQSSKEALENLNKDLNKLSIEHVVSKRQLETYSFLIYPESPK